MGHFYRALNILEYFKRVNERVLVVINQDRASIQILDEKKIPYEVVDYTDTTSNWEKDIIQKIRRRGYLASAMKNW